MEEPFIPLCIIDDGLDFIDGADELIADCANAGEATRTSALATSAVRMRLIQSPR